MPAIRMEVDAQIREGGVGGHRFLREHQLLCHEVEEEFLDRRPDGSAVGAVGGPHLVLLLFIGPAPRGVRKVIGAAVAVRGAGRARCRPRCGARGGREVLGAYGGRDDPLDPPFDHLLQQAEPAFAGQCAEAGGAVGPRRDLAHAEAGPAAPGDGEIAGAVRPLGGVALGRVGLQVGVGPGVVTEPDPQVRQHRGDRRVQDEEVRPVGPDEIVEDAQPGDLRLPGVGYGLGRPTYERRVPAVDRSGAVQHPGHRSESRAHPSEEGVQRGAVRERTGVDLHVYAQRFEGGDGARQFGGPRVRGAPVGVRGVEDPRPPLARRHGTQAEQRQSAGAQLRQAPGGRARPRPAVPPVTR
ncbi:hypothetical protein RB201_09505 [Streptomyces sp. S1A(2023)]